MAGQPVSSPASSALNFCPRRLSLSLAVSGCPSAFLQQPSLNPKSLTLQEKDFGNQLLEDDGIQILASTGGSTADQQEPYYDPMDERCLLTGYRHSIGNESKAEKAFMDYEQPRVCYQKRCGWQMVVWEGRKVGLCAGCSKELNRIGWVGVAQEGFGSSYNFNAVWRSKVRRNVAVDAGWMKG
ncbi:hypothetical protein HPP92_029084 [Vanilla planifolia]|uniref:Uncharacterized protein n=1 Tax=Vanilla planifolia TaxID=51239 RepID=A0A835P4Y2_VANPL|nr:hypothetical protein HPP92_029073 [Vanilla planifolia]KAG0445943.1 hypothetical protein HPP92_029084 [Vanilla planifolia]